MIDSAQALEALVREVGLLPFVRCGMEGFSLKDCTPPGMWFVRGVEGPWEWRETVADAGNIAYGKLFAGKSGFASPVWYAALVNWRRKGLSFAERYEDGMIPRREKEIMDLLARNGPMLTRDLRAALGEKGLDTALTSLQMRTDVLISGMEHKRDAFGRPYGIGVSRIAPSEQVLGAARVRAQLDRPPEDSYQALFAHIRRLLPAADEKAIARLLR